MNKQKSHEGLFFRECRICRGSLARLVDPEKVRINHKLAMARREHDEAMRDIGLIKVRGALGGTYWE